MLKTKNTGFIPLIIVAVIAILVAGGVAGGVYFSEKSSTPEEREENGQSEGTTNSTVVDIATDANGKVIIGNGQEGKKTETITTDLMANYKGPSAEQIFRTMRVEFDATKNFAELEAVNLKYASAKHRDEIIKARTAYGTVSSQMQENLFKLAKSNLPSSKEITSITSTTASAMVTLKITTSRPNLEGGAVFVLQNDALKLDSEFWNKPTN